MLRKVIKISTIIALSILISGCSLDSMGQEIIPERIRDTTWICTPTIMSGMEVVKLSFSERGDDGNVTILIRGEKKERRFKRKGNELHFLFPSFRWIFITDYDTKLTVDHGEGEVDFVRYRSEMESLQAHSI